jgi:predicted CopG family antitoxin
VVDRLRAMRGHGESYSDVILRLVEETSACAR